MKKNIILLFVFLLTTTSYGEVTETETGILVNNKNLSLSITIPAGFKELPSDLRPENWSYGFIEDVSEEIHPITIGIEALGGTLNRPHSINLEEIKKFSPPNTQIEKFPINVLGFDLEGVRSIIFSNNIENVAYSVQIPTKPEAIQVLFGGASEREFEVESVLSKVLSSLKAESNWLSEYDASTRLGQGIGIIVSIIIGIVVVVCIKKNSNKT